MTLSYSQFYWLVTMVLMSLISCQTNKEWVGECSSPHQIGTIDLSNMPDNSLRLSVAVQTENGKDAYIRYWEQNTQNHTDSTILYSAISKNSDSHFLVLINVKPETDYYFNVVVQDGHCKSYSKTYEFTSNPVPIWVPYSARLDSMASVDFDGYVHFHSRFNPGYLFIANSEGKLIWYQKAPSNVKVSTFTSKGTFLTIASKDTLRFSGGDEIAEVALTGEVLFSIKQGEKGFGKVAHHEIDFDEKGNILTLVHDDRVVDLSKVGGNKKDTVRGDGILVLNKKGQKVWEWSVFDVFRPDQYDNILNERSDWLHANSLFKDALGNYLISFRNNSQIWKVDSTGSLVWKFGGVDGGFDIPDSAKFYGQHHVRFDVDGNLVLLDNGNVRVKPGLIPSETEVGLLQKRPTSRMLTFRLDEKRLQAKLIDEVEFPDIIYTASQGSAEKINDDLILYSSSNRSMVAFCDPIDGHIVGNIMLQYETYRAQYIPRLMTLDHVK